VTGTYTKIYRYTRVDTSLYTVSGVAAARARSDTRYSVATSNRRKRDADVTIIGLAYSAEEIT